MNLLTTNTKIALMALIWACSCWLCFVIGSDQARETTVLEYTDYVVSTAKALDNAQQLLQETAAILERLQGYDCKPKSGDNSRLPI